METLDVCRVIGLGRPVEPAGFGRLIPCRYLHEHDTEPYRSRGWVQRVADLRTKALRRVVSPFWLSLDADIRLSGNALLEALDFLKENPTWGGLGLWNHTTIERPKEHRGVAMNCALFRSEATDGLTFRVSPQGWCECICFSLDIRERGYTVGYHPTLTSVHLREA